MLSSTINEGQLLASLIAARKPVAVGKIGGTEGNALEAASSLFVRFFRRSRLRRRMHYLYERSGVFPHRPDIFFRFAEFYGTHVLPSTDFLCRWRGKDDDWAKRHYKLQAQWFAASEFGGDFRWLDGFDSRRFVVVTSFVNTVREQLSRLKQVWGRDSFPLGEHNVRLVQCPHYAHLVDPVDSDWFTALDRLGREMNSEAYDVALIGAGAWGLPLAVKAREKGRIGIHLGGHLQLAFGIKGARWDAKEDTLANEHWRRVLASDTPPRLLESSSDFRKDCAYW